MSFEYSCHYTIAEATGLLPRVKSWLSELVEVREQLQDLDDRHQNLNEPFFDFGGPQVNLWVRGLARTKELLIEFSRRDIQIKDLDRGLVDFPAIIGGKEVFLCWEKDEADIEYWHELDAGYGGRQPI